MRDMANKVIYGFKPDGSPIQTQREAVLDYLKRGFTLTQKEALAKWSIMRLPAVIDTLRKQLVIEGGRYRIITEDMPHTNRFGAPCRYGKYRLERVEKEEIMVEE